MEKSVENREFERVLEFLKKLPTEFISVKTKPINALYKECGISISAAPYITKILQESQLLEIIGKRSGIRYRAKKSEFNKADAVHTVDSFHMIPAYRNKSFISQRKPKLDSAPPDTTELIKNSVEEVIERKPVPLTIVFGRKYYYILDGMIGVGVLTTVEAKLNAENDVIGYRYVVKNVKTQKSVIVEELYDDALSVINSI